MKDTVTISIFFLFVEFSLQHFHEFTLQKDLMQSYQNLYDEEHEKPCRRSKRWNFGNGKQKQEENKNRAINYTFGGKDGGQKQKKEKTEEKDEEFESLLKSFKKVCTIVESNDKRLRGVNPALRL